MKNKEYSSSQLDLFRTILTLEQDELHTMLLEVISSFYKEEDITASFGDYIFVRGEIGVLVVAHLDTVHKIKPKLNEIYTDHEHGVMWSPRGIGGDDRCGVFIILNLLFKGYRPYISFVWDEETGCIGSRKMVKDIDCYEVDFAIQFDRRGSGEAVYYDLHNPEFEDYISNFGFKTHIGSFSDISEICPAWDMAGVNVSAGYVREHSESETIYLDVLYDTLSKTCKILDDQKENPTYFQYKEISDWGKYSTADVAAECIYCGEKLDYNEEFGSCPRCYYKMWEGQSYYDYRA